MVEKESSLQKIKRFVNNQHNIRNIATSAHIHHGKCISGDSRIMLSNGRLATAKEIFEQVMQSGEIYEENEDHTVFTPKEDLEIFSLDKESQNIIKKKIQYAWRLKGGNTIKINLRNGLNAITTPEHRFLVYRDGFVYVQAKDIKLGDRIACMKHASFFWKENKSNPEDYVNIEVTVDNGNGQKLIKLIKSS